MTEKIVKIGGEIVSVTERLTHNLHSHKKIKNTYFSLQ